VIGDELSSPRKRSYEAVVIFLGVRNLARPHPSAKHYPSSPLLNPSGHPITSTRMVWIRQRLSTVVRFTGSNGIA
jgi:hypothetical protein